MKNLMIVESTKKVNTIKGFLGDDWLVEATQGHIRDLPIQKLGVNKKSLEVEYEFTEKGQYILNKLKKLSKDVDMVYIATDLDREGEAIADHLRECLELDSSKYKRCIFSEITEKAILSAVENPQPINEEKVKAQLVRRIVDRLVGYESTRALRIRRGYSNIVGRAQTPALWLVVDRDTKFENFESEPHYGVKLTTKDGWTCTLNTEASKLEDSDKLFKDKEHAQKIANVVRQLKVANSKKTTRSVAPPNAFKTTTMQKAGINKLKITGKKVMDLASNLFDEGFITYIRTDVEVMSDEAYSGICDYIAKNRPELTVSPNKRSPSGKKNSNIQEAHEGIRPSNFEIDTLPKIEGFTKQHEALYKLIFERAVASQLCDAKFEGVKLNLVGSDGKRDYCFDASSSRLVEAGWREFTEKDTSVSDDDDSEDNSGEVPLLNKGDEVAVEKGELQSKKTAPKPRYTEISLIDDLESLGIGRPSTYQTIISRLGADGHGYVETRKEKNRDVMVSTDKGRKLIADIKDNLGQTVLNIEYTKQLECDLDSIEQGDIKFDEMLFDFIKELDQENNALISSPDFPCGLNGCKAGLIRLKSKASNNYFWACSDRSCKNQLADDISKPGLSFTEERQKQIDTYSKDDGTPMHPCPNCKSALIKKEGKFGNYWGCSRQHSSDCSYTALDYEDRPVDREELLELEIKKFSNEDGTPKFTCKKCNSPLLQKQGKFGLYWSCSRKKDKECKYTAQDVDGNAVDREELLELEIKKFSNEDGTPKFTCKKCNSPLLQKQGKFGLYWTCSRKKDKECKYTAQDVDGNAVDREELLELEIKKFSNEDGTPMHPCPECSSPLIQKEGKFGKYWDCSKTKDAKCKHRTKDKDGKPMKVDNSWKELLAKYTKADGKPKYPCPDCKSALVPRKGVKGDFWGCSKGKACGYATDDDGGKPKSKSKGKSKS